MEKLEAAMAHSLLACQWSTLFTAFYFLAHSRKRFETLKVANKLFLKTQSKARMVQRKFRRYLLQIGSTRIDRTRLNGA
jgi:hypothetical protein